MKKKKQEPKYQIGATYRVTMRDGLWSAEGKLVHVFPANEPLDPEDVRKYYGHHVSEPIYTPLKIDRVVIQRPDGKYAVAPMYESTTMFRQVEG